tara:strand:- start:327 stop:683 length:357 start_codon:yes stop_codon:yes gene_type:complete
MELYIKTGEDPNFDPLSVDTENEVQQLITQLETILFTNKQSVLGQPGFGVNLEDLIYSFNFNEYEIKRIINDQLRDYCPLAGKYNVDVDIEFSKGEYRDAAVLSLTIDNRYVVGVKIE